MKAKELVIEVRDATYNRIGQILPNDLTDFTIVAKFNSVGTWKLTLPAEHYLVDTLRTAGSGIVVNGPTGVIISGPTVSAKNIANVENPKGVWEIEGRDDSIILSERLAYPTPITADVEAQTNAYDTRTGAAETIIKEYVKANIGINAPIERKITNLTVETDTALGSTITTSARFNKLDKLISAIASIDKLGYTIEQEGDILVFKIYNPIDRSGTIRMDIDNNQLASTEYIYKQPEVTRVIVGGAGSAEQRTFIEASNASSIAGETDWNRRIEVFHDARSSQDAAELAQAGAEELVDKGKTQESISITPSDYTSMVYGTDWGLGDIVSVVVDNKEVKQIITEVGLLINSDGVTVKATVGPAPKNDLEDALVYLQGKSDDRLDNLERNGEGGGAAAASRESIVYTTPVLAPNETYTTSINIAAGYRLLFLSTTVPARVRLYTKVEGQTADLLRLEGSRPYEGHGLIFDFVTAPYLLSADLNPTIDGFTFDMTSISVPLTITNKSNNAAPVQITFIYIKTE